MFPFSIDNEFYEKKSFNQFWIRIRTDYQFLKGAQTLSCLFVLCIYVSRGSQSWGFEKKQESINSKRCRRPSVPCSSKYLAKTRVDVNQELEGRLVDKSACHTACTCRLELRSHTPIKRWVFLCACDTGGMDLRPSF